MNIRRFIGLSLVLSGFIALYLGELLNTYQERHTTYWFSQPIYYFTYPYQNYALPSAVVGIVLIVVGVIFYVANVQREKKTFSQTPSPLSAEAFIFSELRSFMSVSRQKNVLEVQE